MKFDRFESKHHHFRLVISFFCALCSLCVSISAQEWTTVKDGVEYAQVTKEISGLNVNMNLLRLDLKKVRLDVVHAMDAAIGTERTSSMATRHGAARGDKRGFLSGWITASGRVIPLGF